MFDFLEDADQSPVRIKIVGVGDFGEKVLNSINQSDVADSEILYVSSEDEAADVEEMLEETELLILISRAEDEFSRRILKRAKDLEVRLIIGFFDSDCSEDVQENLDVFAVEDPIESVQAIITIVESIKSDAVVSLEFRDVQYILKGNRDKKMFVATNTDSDAESTARAIVDSPRWKGRLANAKKIMMRIVGDTDKVSMADVYMASTAVQEAVNPDSEIIWGASIDDSLEDKDIVTIITIGSEQ